MSPIRRVVVAPDKFRDSARAPEIAAAMATAAERAGWECTQVPLADGGEGMLEVFGGPNRATVVSDPLGDPVEAPWRLEGRTAYVEMALASGLALVGGADGNDVLGASTYGTGELIEAAIERGASRVVVGMGGSATTDGGLGALRAVYPVQRLKGIDLVVACDVRTRFLDAAEVFAPQKGASERQVELLRRRLERLAQVYLAEYGVDVTTLGGSGAAGGLAGGLAAVGAQLVPGFELVAEELDLAGAVHGADLLVTGEGSVDEQSFEGKVVGGVVELGEELGVPVVVVAGRVDDGAGGLATVVSLSERFGTERSMTETTTLVTEVTAELLTRR